MSRTNAKYRVALTLTRYPKLGHRKHTGVLLRTYGIGITIIVNVVRVFSTTYDLSALCWCPISVAQVQNEAENREYSHRTL